MGPLVLIAASGVLMELLHDQVTLLAPTDPAEVERALRGLRLYRLLAGFRGSAPVDMPALVSTIVASGWLAADLVQEYRNSQAGGARRIAVGTALALTDYPWSLARLAAAEIADGAR